jgi:hypothetical protein
VDVSVVCDTDVSVAVSDTEEVVVVPEDIEVNVELDIV